MSENQEQIERKKPSNGNGIIIGGIVAIVLIAIIAIFIFIDHVYGGGSLLFNSGVH